MHRLLTAASSIAVLATLSWACTCQFVIDTPDTTTTTTDTTPSTTSNPNPTTTTTTTNNTPPTVVSVSPADAANDVDPDTSIVITFSEPMNTGVGTVTLEASDGTEIDTQASWNTAGTELTLVTALGCLPDDTYDVTVETSFADEAGLALENEFTSSFTTRQTNLDLWTGSVSANWFNDSFAGVEDCIGINPATTRKQIEFVLPVTKGNVNIAPYAVQLSIDHSWSTAAGQDGSMIPADGDLTESATYDVDFSYIYDDGTTITAVVTAPIYAGWNEFRGTMSVTPGNFNTTCDQVIEVTPVRQMFSVGGGPNPFRAELSWDTFGADMDLVVHEAVTGSTAAATDRFIYWGEPGYEGASCASAQNCGDPTIIGGPCDPCFTVDNYLIGVDRTEAFSYGSLDKDDQARGGPEVYSLDPTMATACDGTTTVVSDTPVDGDSLRVYTVFYSNDGGNVADVEGVVTVNTDGTDQATACYTTGTLLGTVARTISESDTTTYTDQLMADYAIPADPAMLFVGEFVQTAGAWTWDDSASQLSSFAPTDGVCVAP